MEPATLVRVYTVCHPAGPDHEWARSLPACERTRQVHDVAREAMAAVPFRRWVARHAIARELGVDPRDVVFDRSCTHCGDRMHGRPRLAGEYGAGTSFSASSTGGFVAVAISHDGTVGLDVEHVRDVTTAMVDLACSADERAQVLAQGERERGRAFVELWARKEAVLKARGTGIVTPPIAQGPHRARTASRSLHGVLQASDYVTTTFSLADGVVGAIATARRPRLVFTPAAVVGLTDRGAEPTLALLPDRPAIGTLGRWS